MQSLIYVLSALFIFAGLANLSGHPRVIKLYTDMGVDVRLRFVAGLLELIGGIGLLTPYTKWAALELSIFMAAALIVHIMVKDKWYNTAPSLVLMVVCYYLFGKL